MLCLYVLFLGSSPHPSTPDEDDSQTELLIAEEKLSPEDEGQIMPRYKRNCLYVHVSSRHHLKLFFLQLDFRFLIPVDRKTTEFVKCIRTKLQSLPVTL